MLHLYISNRTEALFESLSNAIATPDQNVFQPEIILVEQKGIARWLTQRIAEQQGIAANINFPLPTDFIHRLLQDQLQERAAEVGFSQSSLMWYSMALLPTLKAEAGFEAIKHYLADREEETKIYQLSRRIAHLFDQYLIYRPDMIKQWEAGEDNEWQAKLWRAMREISNESNWLELVSNFRKSVESEGLRARGLPRRISLFGISWLSPAYIELIARIAEYIDVYLYLLSPSIIYWGDILSDQNLVKLRNEWHKHARPDVSDLDTLGNPLFASMGVPCHDFLEQWHDYTQQAHECFKEPVGASLLANIQRDILYHQTRGEGGIPVHTRSLDDSIQVHACHSPMREVQILHDRLLGLFNRRPDLQPHEIVVTAPDITSYAPYIEAVFGSVPEQRHIPYSIADQTISLQPLVETLLSWLLLPEERFEAPTVIGWLEVPAVQAKLELDADALERIRHWIDQSGIRWGLDGQHKTAFGLPDNEQNTWTFGFKRLFLGYAMPTHSELFQAIAPYSDIEGGESIWLGQLQAFIEQLANWKREFASPVNIRAWQRRINRLIEQLLLPNQQEALLIDIIQEQVARMVASAETAGFDREISAPIMHQHLSSMLAAPGNSYRLLDGRVTFCNMSSVRSIPFRVVCMLGMNNGAFPRNDRPLGFDLIARHPRKGDRSPRDDDRYLFLQAVLSTREVLHLSYIGRSQQDNSMRLPAVVITELLDFIEQGYRIENQQISRALHIEHPLQPFSMRSFEIGSYAAEWQERDETQEVFAAKPITPHDDDETRERVTLETLIRFLANPSRYFLENSLGIHSAEYNEMLEACERFELDPLAAYSIKDELLSNLLIGKSIEQSYELCYVLFRAKGELPHGELGRHSYHDAMDELATLAERVGERLDGNQQDLEVELTISGLMVTGWLTHVIEGVLVRYRPAKVKAKDKLSLWIEHLALCASGNRGESVHLGIDKDIALTPLDQDDALGHLENIVSLYKAGEVYPVPLLLNSSIAYAEKYQKTGDADKAYDAARSKWESTLYSVGDGDDPWIGQAFRDCDPYGDDFERIAKEILVPMLACTNQAEY